jgi:hypothetical protein
MAVIKDNGEIEGKQERLGNMAEILRFQGRPDVPAYEEPQEPDNDGAQP